MRLIKYNNSLGEGTLKAIHTMEQVHSAFQSKEPASLGLEPYTVCGNWYLYMDVETTSCGHLYHHNCLRMHLQESTSCKKCGQFLHPLWFDSKCITCVEKEEVALGMDTEVKMWLEHRRSAAIQPGKPS
jgi:hypothetical protein